MTKTLYVFSAIALVAIGFALGVFGAHLSTPEKGAVGATAYDVLNQVGDIYQGLNHTLIAQSGNLVGPLTSSGLTPKTGTATYNPPSLTDGSVATTTLTVTGAVAGSPCLAGFSTLNAAGGMMVTCQYQAAGTALVTFDNESGITQDNATGTLRAIGFSY